MTEIPFALVIAHFYFDRSSLDLKKKKKPLLIPYWENLHNFSNNAVEKNGDYSILIQKKYNKAFID